jgi:amino acid adenylation domain-containing protein/non-ribosomal peptide synthase protein (TIGR01720 family)
VVDAIFQALNAIVEDPGRQLPVMDLLVDNGRQRIQNWNSNYPSAIESTVPAIFGRQVVEARDAPAVASWDGELTYNELDRVTDRLAYHLRTLGVGPEVSVPLCFRKSLWAVVAMMAVMKAGGAFVPLDPAHPPERIQRVLEQLPSRIVALASPDATHIVSQGIQTTIALDAQFCNQLPAYGESGVSAATPDNAAYIMFTSGPSGASKGAVLQHRAVCSSIMAHGRQMNHNKDSRVLQFSSYGIDASVTEIITTLVHGGCVCIPSDDERTNGIATSINRLRVNWAFLPPAVASMLDPMEVPTLRTLAIGGDVIGHSIIKKWDQGSCRVIQAYGPTECGVFCLSQDRTGKPVHPEILGNAMGCTTWIVDPKDPDVLMPMGAVGELLIQGPIQASGYLNDSEQTNSAFLTELTWLPEDIKHARLFKTGDLVRYNEDGTIAFIGRKDTQVKVNGQRIELRDVDYQIAASQEQIQAQQLLLGSTGKFSGKMVLVLAFRNLGNQLNGHLKLLENHEQITAVAQLAEIQNFIADKLPTYMHPFAMIVVNSLPTNTSDVIDTRRVTAWVNNMDNETYAKVMNIADSEASAPADEVDQIIQTAISEVINLHIQHVNMNRSFISLGGDSITAMQLMAICRRQHISLSVQDILSSPNIATMTAKAKTARSTTVAVERFEERENVAFPLAPIQKLFFSQFPDGINHYNQSMLLKLHRPVSSTTVAKAIEELVQRHSMLRARYRKDPYTGQWTQRLSTEEKESFSFGTLELNAWEETQAPLMEAEESLDITRGPLLAARMVKTPDCSALFLAAHHLVIDLVSWRTLLKELEQLIYGISLPTAPPFSYQQWVHSLHSYAEANPSPAPLLPFAVPKSDLGFWGMESAPNNSTNLVLGEFKLTPDITAMLRNEANKALKAEMIDVLLAIAAHTFAVTFPERQIPAFHAETHGREHPLGADVAPVHETIGWFTAIAPLVLTRGEDYVDAVRRAKDTRRAVPVYGIPYFTADMLSAQNADDKVPMEILFNYHGQFQQFERADGLFEQLPRSMGPEDIKLSAARLSLIDLEAVIERDALTMSWSYSADIKHQGRIEQWLSLFKQGLTDVALALKKTTAQLTKSDMPLLPIAQEQLVPLNKALAKLSRKGGRGIEDVYPLAPVQRGILLSQTVDSTYYDVHVVYEVRAGAGGDEVDVFRFQRAWDRVIQFHPMLRTVFLPSFCDDGLFDQVVLSTYHPVSTNFTFDEDDEEMALEELWDAAKGPYLPNVPQHRMAFCSSSDGKLFAHLQISHSIVDAVSLKVLTTDWTRAYAGELPTGSGPLYSNYIAHIQKSSSLDASLQFWTNNLEGVTPCKLPRLTDGVLSHGPRQQKRFDLDIPFADDLRNLAKTLNISVSSIFQLAWALVLRSYTGADDVCFGYVTSGRDSEIDGIQDAFGPFINILLSRVTFDNDSTISSLLKKLFGTYIDSLPHQYASLAEIQHALKLGSEHICNTGISYQKSSSSSQVQKPQISFDIVDSKDPTEVSDNPFYLYCMNALR